LISNAYLELGQFYEIMHTLPTLAIKYYKKSLIYNSLNRNALAYLADCYQDIGKFKLAISHYNKAIKINNDYEWVNENLLECKEKLNKRILKDDIYDIVSLEYKAMESLANFNPIKTRQIIQNKRKKEYKVIEIKILGYENRSEEYIKAWQKYFELGNTVYLSGDDWFYMPTPVYDDIRIWKLFLKYSSSIEESMFITFDTLSKYQSKNKALKIQKIICQFMVYKIEKNINGLHKLQKKFPDWKEATKELNRYYKG